MVPGDHPGTEPIGVDEDSHWVRWHAPYEDPSSNLSRRLQAVQSMVAAALDEITAGGPAPATVPSPAPAPAPAPGRSRPLDTNPEHIRMVSLCAGQGRDVIDVVASHPRGPDVSALLVELDPALVDFARSRAAAAGAGVAEQIRVVEGDASQCRWYADDVPADIVLVCGVFGNISEADITRTIQAMPGFCAPGGHVVWTRHRRPPDLTPAIRANFAASGFTELGFVASADSFMGIGHHRLDGSTAPFDPDQILFDFVGDGFNPV